MASFATISGDRGSPNAAVRVNVVLQKDDILHTSWLCVADMRMQALGHQAFPLRLIIVNIAIVVRFLFRFVLAGIVLIFFLRLFVRFL